MGIAGDKGRRDRGEENRGEEQGIGGIKLREEAKSNLREAGGAV